MQGTNYSRWREEVWELARQDRLDDPSSDDDGGRGLGNLTAAAAALDVCAFG